MRSIVLGLIVVIGVAIGARSASAQVYGTAGCGLGSVLFGAKPGFIQVLAATTNGTFGNQTFGITSGTLNCGPSAPSGTIAYVEANRQQLAKEIARGSGETIDGLATVAGCGDSRVVGARLQSQYKSIFAAAALTDEQVGQNVVTVLKGDRSLRCSKL
jgi:hypothetical protein